MNASRWITAAIILLVRGAPVIACPFCESATGEQVRAGVFNEDFAYHFGVMLLPFALLLLVVGWIHGGGRVMRREEPHA